MNCLICGRPNSLGKKLCSDCRAARKRAFAATVTQPLLAAAGAAGGTSSRLLRPGRPLTLAAERAGRRAAATTASAANEPVSRPKWPLVAAALAILLIAGVYFTQRGMAEKQIEAAMPSSAEEVARDGAQAPSKAANAETKPAAAQPTASPSAPLTAEVPIFQPAMPAGIDTPKRQSARARPSPPVVVEIAPEPPPAVEPAAPPPPPEVREAPRPDPWQPLNDALARCPRNDILGRSICEYRVRSQYCNGYWGQVPQCASVPYIDHGQ